MRKWIFSAAIPFALVLSACSATKNKSHDVAHEHMDKLCAGFLPENDMYIPESKISAAAAGISQTKFNEVLNRIQAQYNSEFSQYGVTLTIERNWSDGTVNAYAYRVNRNWTIAMYGGFARHKSITYDGFAAVACHEIGHHVGGAPLYDQDWASVEGQSDYYATTKCLKRLFERDDNEKILAGMKLDSTAVKKCNSEHSSKQDRLLCIRAAMAGVSLAGVLQDFDGGGKKPTLATPDKKVVNQTIAEHPEAQCRLDTYFQGSLCRQGQWSAVSESDPAIGYCYDSRTYRRGLRPRCWFAPQ